MTSFEIIEMLECFKTVRNHGCCCQLELGYTLQ